MSVGEEQKKRDRKTREHEETRPEKMRSQVFIGVGSNLGDRRAYYHQALGRLAALPRTSLGRCSSLYETEPISADGPTGAAERWYVNGVVEL